MGCSTSAPATNAPEGNEKLTAAQRRRLSVAPGLLNGDAGVDLAADEAEESEAQKAKRAALPHGMVSLKGMVPYSKKKVNQDRPVHKYCMKGDDNIHLFGVMDGHGEFGHLVSAFIRANLPLMLEEQDLRGDPHKAITDGVANMVAALERTEIDIQFSGSTLVFSVAIDNKLYTANVGDSRCIVAKQKGGSWTSTDLSVDQKPDSPGEKERILGVGGRVGPLPGFFKGEDCGPQRVWLATVDVPGLAMSRSIGDKVSQQAGVISVPVIEEYDIEVGDLFIWASDGVWEFLESDAVMNLMTPHHEDVALCAKKVAAESRKQWQKQEEVIDDITCIIVKWTESATPAASPPPPVEAEPAEAVVTEIEAA